MKRFIRACLVAVLVFVVAGIVLLVVAAAGGVTRASLRMFHSPGRVSYGPFHFITGDGVQVKIGGLPVVSIGDGDDCEDGADVICNHETYQITDEVQDLYIDAAAGSFEIRTSEDEYFYVQADDTEFQIKYKNKKLRVERTDKEVIDWNLIKDTTAILYVPEDYYFEELTMDVAAGDLQVNAPLTAKDVQIQVGAGNVTVNSPISADSVELDVSAGNIDGYECISTKDKMELTVNAGNISLHDIACDGPLYAECHVGNMDVVGEAGDDITAECDAGSMVLNLKGTGQKYYYKLKSGLGELSVNNVKYDGLDTDVSLEGDKGAPTAKLTCGLGDLEFHLR